MRSGGRSSNAVSAACAAGADSDRTARTSAATSGGGVATGGKTISGSGRASGGVSGAEDLRKLARMGVYGAITGKALYEGKVSMREIVEIGE